MGSGPDVQGKLTRLVTTPAHTATSPSIRYERYYSTLSLAVQQHLQGVVHRSSGRDFS